MKDIQCYELFGGIALKNHAFSFLRRNELRCTVRDIRLSKCSIIIIICHFMLRGWEMKKENVNEHT